MPLSGVQPQVGAGSRSSGFAEELSFQRRIVEFRRQGPFNARCFTQGKVFADNAFG